MCRTFWQGVWNIGSVIVKLWQLVATIVSSLWKYCTEQKCYWWCLCCNKWLCWIVTIILAIILTVTAVVFSILYVVFSIVLAIVCETLCLIVFMLSARSPNPPRCFSLPSSSSSRPSGSGSSGGGLTSPPTTTGPQTGTGSNIVTRSGNIPLIIMLGQIRNWRAMQFLIHTVTTPPRQIRSSTSADRYVNIPLSTDDPHAAVCGCREGKIGMGISAAIVIPVLMLLPRAIRRTRRARVGLGVTAILVGSAVGKAIGLARALSRSSPLNS